MPPPASPDAPDAPTVEYVDVARFPKTVAWPQVAFFALVVAATLLPLALAFALAA